MSSEFIDFCNSNQLPIPEDEIKNKYLSMSDEYKSFVTEKAFAEYFCKRNPVSILWHDYECGGKQPKTALPMQFAAIRTNLNHEFIDTPIDVYCKLSKDKLPHPEAIKITKISPMKCELEGVPEPVFFRILNSEMMIPGSCVTGYNSIKYDDEVTRFGFWRNLIPVYDREFKNNNSRWDLINVSAAYKALPIDGINWPTNEEGKPSLRLELLASANDITQDNAHNAVDDVKALIGWSKLLKQRHPILWNHLFEMRNKNTLINQLKENSRGIIFSPMCGADNNFNSKVLFAGIVPGNKNKYSFAKIDDVDKLRKTYSDLMMSEDKSKTYEATSEELSESIGKMKETVFSKNDVLEENGLERPSLTTITINKCPVFISADWLSENFPDVWTVTDRHLSSQVSNVTDFISAIPRVFESEFKDFDFDFEIGLYSTGFPSKNDKWNLEKLVDNADDGELFFREYYWTNPGFNELLFACKSKLADAGVIELTESELMKWEDLKMQRLASPLAFSENDELVTISNYEELAKTHLDGVLLDDYLEWASIITK